MAETEWPCNQPGIAPPAAGSMLVKPGGGGPIGEPWPNPGGGPATSQENFYIKAIKKRNNIKEFENETMSKHSKTKRYQSIEKQNDINALKYETSLNQIKALDTIYTEIFQQPYAMDFFLFFSRLSLLHDTRK